MRKVLEQVAVWAVTVALAAVLIWFGWALFLAPDAEPEPNCTLPNGDRVYVEDVIDGPNGDIQDECREVITDYYEAERPSE